MAIANLERIIPTSVTVAPAERRSVLEIAVLSIAADHSINDDEIAAFRSIARRLFEVTGEKGSGAHAATEELLGKYASALTREEADERLRALAGTLGSTSSRELAYVISYALAMSDLATSDQEFEFDLQLIDALGLSQDTVDRLTGDVVTALNPE